MQLEHDILAAWRAEIAAGLAVGQLSRHGERVTLRSSELTAADLKDLSPSEQRKMRKRS